METGRWLIHPLQTLVSLHQYSAYHSPLNFKDPDMFLPERWLPDSGDEFNNDNKHVFQPFSYGPRNCLGKKYVNGRTFLPSTCSFFLLC
jgi:cytochrome P450